MQKSRMTNRKDNIKKLNASFVTIIMLLSTMTAMTVFFAAPAVSEDTIETSLWTTDINGNIVTDFAPGEIVYINGEGFTPGATINISMTRPDGEIEYADSNPRFIDGEPTADDTGCFELCSYDLDGITGVYTVAATDGVNSDQVTFTDSRTINWVTVNGGSSTAVTPGDTITVTLSVTTSGSGSSDNWRSTTWEIMGTGGSSGCADTPDHTSDGTYTESFTITAPMTPGVYDFRVRAYRDNGCTGDPSSWATLTDAICVCDSYTDLLDDGFENTGSAWDDNWDGNGATDWHQTTSEHSGIYAAEATTEQNHAILTSDNLDTSGASFIVVDFWFRKAYLNSDEFTLYYYDGTHYDNVAELDTLGSDSTWLHYTDVITDSQYFKSNFRIRFDGTLTSGMDYVQVDDVLISICGGCTPTTWYHDADGDGYTNNADTQEACSDPDGTGTEWVDTPTLNDCDDTDTTVHPWAEEICDGKDNDCDGKIDEGCCEHSCLIPDTLGDTTQIDVKDGPDELQSLIDSYTNLSSYLPIYIEGPYSDQSHYQIWDIVDADVVKIRVEFVGREADNSNVFGYYTNGDTSTFKALFCVEGQAGGGHYHDGYPDIPRLEPGEYITDILLYKGDGEELGFGICSDDSTGPGVGDNNSYYTKISDNDGDGDHALVFDLCDGHGKYVVCFEDLPIGDSDADYDDVVTIVDVLDCYTNLDFGDAPYDDVNYFYPTLLANDGARHNIGGPYLGPEAPDAETDGQPTANADGDDNYNVDDENGVTIPPLEIGQINNIGLEVNGAAGNVYVDAWIDYDQNGIWEHPAEHAWYYLGNGAYSASINVPSGLSTGTTYARFRISSEGSLLPTGLAQDGEVEDYVVELVDTIEPTQTIEFGDPKDPDAYPGGLWRLGGNTPIWVNSTDFGTGTKFMEIYVWWNPISPNEYDSVMDYYYVEDNDDMDTDPTPGRISVILYMDESCYHEIDIICEDWAGNVNEYYGPDFLVDADGPVVTKEIGDPQCGDYISTSTRIWLNATDPIVGDINCSTQCIESIHWRIWRWVDGDWELIGEYFELDDSANFTFGEECKHKLEYWAVDCLGNIGQYYEQIHYVDNTPPTSTIIIPMDCYDPTGGKIYIRNDSLITIKAEDTKGLCNVGSTKIHYRVWANGQWTTEMTGTVDQDVNFKLVEDLGAPWENDCTHYIEYYAEDCLHNTENPINNVTVYVDNTGPEKVEMNIVSGLFHIRSSDGKIFITKDTFISLSSEDQTQPDCASNQVVIYYQIWYDDVWREIQTYNDEPFNFTENCTHMVKAWAVDCLGNIGEENITTFYVDTEKPELSTEYLPGFYYKDGRNWIAENTIKRVTAVDAGCGVGGAGVAMLEWKVVNTTADPDIVITGIVYDNNTTAYEDDHVKVTGDNDPADGVISIDIQIKESCEHTIWHRGIDFLGNDDSELGWGNKQNVKVDTKPPIVKKEVGEPKYNIGLDDGDYFITNQTRIYINATDDPSGDPCVVGSVNLQIGVWYNDQWEYWWESVTDGELKVDFTFEELASILNWPELANECVHKLRIYAEDDVGNCWPGPGEYHEETFYVDMTPPDAVKIVGDPKYNVGLPAGDYYVRGDTPITIKVTDIGTEPCIVGSTHLYYRIWYNGIWHYYEEHSLNGIDHTFTFNQKELGDDCVHYLEYYVEDNLGNRWPECGYHNETFYVDNTPPSVNKVVGEPKYQGNLQTGDWYITKDTPITIDVTEQGIAPCIVGSTTLYYEIDYKGQTYPGLIHHEKTEGPINFEFTFAELATQLGVPELANDCVHKLRIYAEDNLGNHWPECAAYHEETFYVDNTPPVATKEVGEPKYQGNLQTGDWYVTRYTPIYINVTDDQTKGCAVNSTHIKLTLTYDGTTKVWWENSTTGQNLVYTFNDLSCMLEWPELGNDCIHILTFEAWDDLGNYYGPHTETFYVDNQPPVSTKIVGEPKYQGFLNEGNWYVTSQTPIWINATDNTTFDPCVVGSVHLHYRVYYYKTGTYTQEETITVESGTLSKMITLEGECIHRLDYYVEDDLGNRWPPALTRLVDDGETTLCIPGEPGWHSEWFYVDNSEPEVTKTVKCPKYADELPDGDYYVTNKTKIEITVKDQGTCPCIVGSTHLYYALEYNGVWYSDSIHHNMMPIWFKFTFEELADHFGVPEIANDCVHKLRIWAEDNLGNKWPTDAEYHEEIFYVDNTPPVSTKTISEPYCSLKEGTLLLQDDFEYTCTKNPLFHGWFGEYFGKPDTYGIYDDIGTKEIESNQVAEIKDDAAMIKKINTEGFTNIVLSYCAKTTSVSPGDKLRVLYKVGSYSGNVNDWTQLEEINSCTWQCSSHPLTGADDDKVYIAFFMDDGNSDYGLVDNVQVTGDPLYEQPYYWVTTDTEITLTAEDFPDAPCKSGVKKFNFWVFWDHDGDGYADIPVKVNIVEETSNSVTFKFKEECLHKIVWYAEDNVGNKEVMHVQYHRVDDTPPEIIKTVGEPSITDDGETWWVTTDTEINLKAVDQRYPCAVGGVNLEYMIEYRESNTGWLPYTENITFNEHCTHYLYVRAVDCLGNIAYDNETFIVHGEIDQIPTLQSPADGSTITDNTPTLDWNDVVGQSNYRLQYSDDIYFADGITVDVSGATEYTIPEPLEDGVYYWHVAVIYTGEVVGQYSDTWWFKLDSGNYRPIVVNIIEPVDDEEFTVECDSRYIPVVVEAYRPTYEMFPKDYNVDVTLWLDNPYGAPDLFYEVTWDEENKLFYAEIPVYMYSSGSELNLEAKAEDSYGNRAYDDTTFTVITTVEYDLWMEEGWNGPINLAVLGCSDFVEDVFASIDPYWTFIFEAGSWSNNYWHNYPDPSLNGGSLQHIDPAGWYWVYMTQAARFFVDNTEPIVTIEYPADGTTLYNNWLDDDIWGITCDIETGVETVILTVYDNDTGEYWNGTAWTTEYTELPCIYDDENHKWYCPNTEEMDLTYKCGHEIILTAKSIDYAGCIGNAVSRFCYIDNNDPYVEILYPDGLTTYTCGLPYEITGEAYDEETIVTLVEVGIYDETASLWWNGSGWGAETYHACNYDPMTTLWDFQEVPEWIHDHWFYIDAWAYDACENEFNYDVSFKYECETCIPQVELEKTVWREEGWDEYTYADVEDTVKFNISIYVPEDGCVLCDTNVTDYLPCGLEYVPGSAVATIITEGGTTVGGAEPGISSYSGGTMLYWSDEGVTGPSPPLTPGIQIYIEFDALVQWCDDFVNTANITADVCDVPSVMVTDEDTAEVWVECEECTPSYTLDKYAYYWSYGQWDAAYAFAREADNYAMFKIEFNVTDDCPIVGDIYIRDDLPEHLVYDGNHTVTVYPPGGVTLTASFYDPCTHAMYFNFTGTLNPGEKIVITFNATYTGNYVDKYSEINTAYGSTNIPDTALVSDDVPYYYNMWLVADWNFAKYTYNYSDPGYSTHGEARDSDNHGQFKIVLYNYGPCTLTDPVIRDELPSTLQWNSTISVDKPSGMTYTHQYNENAEATDYHWWNFTGQLPIGESITIIFDTNFDGCCEDYDTNHAYSVAQEQSGEKHGYSYIHYWCID